MASWWTAAVRRSRRLRIRQRPDDQREGFAPSLWPVWLAVPIWLLVAAAAAWMLNDFLRARPQLVGDDADAIEVTRVVRPPLSRLIGTGGVEVIRFKNGSTVWFEESRP